MRKERVFIDENAHIQNLCCEVNLDGGIPKATISFDNLGYKEGTIRTFEKLVITSEGNLKDGEDVYERNRYSYRSASSSSSSSSSRSGDSYESAYSALHITVDRVQSNSSYTICTGSVKNDGNKTYKFVTLKGSFKDARGNVVDTDWTYGVGAEGLAPGESTTFRLSVPKNYDIVSCSVSIMDYD